LVVYFSTSTATYSHTFCLFFNRQQTATVKYRQGDITRMCEKKSKMPLYNTAYIDLNSFLLEELEETTRTPSYYMDEDYPTGPEIQ